MRCDGVRYHRSGAVLFRNVCDMVLLLDPCDGQVVALGGAGPALWDLLDRPITVAEALRRLADSYAVPAERIAPEVREVFDLLERHDVLVAGES
jgi:hypothetical protein